MFKKLDIYIIRKFLVTFVFSLGIFLAIAVVFDTAEKIDSLIESTATLKVIIVDYYLNFIPHFGILFSPLFIFIAVIFFSSKMADNSEFIAILSSGVSFYRILVPYLIAAGFLASLILYFNHKVVPHANKGRIEFENTYTRNPFVITQRNIHLQLDTNSFISVQSFNTGDSTGYNLTLENIQDNELIYRLKASKMIWDNNKEKWTLQRYQERWFSPMQDRIVRGKEMDTTLDLHPSDFGVRFNIITAMDTEELNEFIAKEKLKGSDQIDFFLIEKYKRTAFPFATFVLTIIGFAMASRKVRGGLGLHLGLGITISFAYILAMQFSTTFSTHGNLPPLLGVWIPNILFGILGIVLLRYAPK